MLPKSIRGKLGLLAAVAALAVIIAVLVYDSLTAEPHREREKQNAASFLNSLDEKLAHSSQVRSTSSRKSKDGVPGKDYFLTTKPLLSADEDVRKVVTSEDEAWQRSVIDVGDAVAYWAKAYVPAMRYRFFEAPEPMVSSIRTRAARMYVAFAAAFRDLGLAVPRYVSESIQRQGFAGRPY